MFTQCEKVVMFIKDKGSMTPMDGFGIGITRLAARVNELRNQGVDIKTEIVETYSGARVAKYTINENTGD